MSPERVARQAMYISEGHAGDSPVATETPGHEKGLAPKRISIDSDGCRIPLIPFVPVLSSATQQWEGFLMERILKERHFAEIPPHSRSTILLNMQLNAGLRVEWKSESGGGTAVLDAGTFTLHGCADCNASVWNGVCDGLLFELDSIHIERLTEGRFPGARVEIAEKWAFKDPRLENLLKVLYEELRQGAPTGPIFAEQLGNAVAMLLARQYSIVTPGIYGSGGRIPTSRLKTIFDYVEAHLHEDVHLSDLAKTAAMSLYYFARLFKNSTGVSPHRYVAQRRIARAKELLRNSEKSVFEIGMCVGYTDAEHFRNLFRREVGVPPRDFRASLMR